MWPLVRRLLERSAKRKQRALAREGLGRPATRYPNCIDGELLFGLARGWCQDVAQYVTEKFGGWPGGSSFGHKCRNKRRQKAKCVSSRALVDDVAIKRLLSQFQNFSHRKDTLRRYKLFVTKVRKFRCAYALGRLLVWLQRLKKTRHRTRH